MALVFLHAHHLTTWPFPLAVRVLYFFPAGSFDKDTPVQSQFHRSHPLTSLSLSLSPKMRFLSILRFPQRMSGSSGRGFRRAERRSIRRSRTEKERSRLTLLGDFVGEGGGGDTRVERVGRGKTELFQAIPPRRGEHRPGSEQICPAMSAKRWWDEGWPLPFTLSLSPVIRLTGIRSRGCTISTELKRPQGCIHSWLCSARVLTGYNFREILLRRFSMLSTCYNFFLASASFLSVWFPYSGFVICNWHKN